jgi:UDP-N-acetylglucosamine 2-epimerase (non-hydrolysing)
LASLHFAPTEQARQNLLAENVSTQAIYVTGNTVIDALLQVREKAGKRDDWQGVFGSAEQIILKRKPYVLITGHRRENFGQGFRDVCEAIAELAGSYPEIHFIYPVHLNPNVQEPVFSVLGGRENIHLIAPLDYAPFVFAMGGARLIITDSGGVQEEAPSFGKPVLVTRETTERPEAVEAGTVLLVGTDKQRIITETKRLLADQAYYRQMADKENPYGDGKAADRIRQILHGFAL